MKWIAKASGWAVVASVAMAWAADLQPFQNSGKWGYLGTAGDTVVAAKYTNCKPFYRGFAQVAIKDSSGAELWGLIDNSGRELMPAKYTNLWIDSSWIRYSVGGVDSTGAFADFWGVVSLNGKVLVKPSLQYVAELKGGRAAFRKGSLWGFLNAEGAEIIAPQYRYQSEFNFGAARATIDGKAYGAIDTNGAPIVPFELVMATDFFEGFAVVQREDQRDVIDNTGKVVLPCFTKCKTYEVRASRKAGYVVASLDDKVGAADRKGKITVPTKYQNIVPTDTGSVWAFQDKGLWGFIDIKTSKVLVKPIYKQVGEFRENMAPVMADSVSGFWAYVDGKGKVLTPVQFLKAGNFSEGLAPAVLPDMTSGVREWVFLDAKGTIALKTGIAFPQYTVLGFDRGCAKVRSAGGDGFETANTGCLDRAGRKYFSIGN